MVANSESRSGGVGILHFDATKTPHDVIGYRRTAEYTPTGSRNCGGGRTPWGKLYLFSSSASMMHSTKSQLLLGNFFSIHTVDGNLGTWLTSEESGNGSVYEVDPNEKGGSDYCRGTLFSI